MNSRDTIVSTITRAAILWYPGSRDGEQSVKETEVAARTLGVQGSRMTLWPSRESRSKAIIAMAPPALWRLWKRA